MLEKKSVHFAGWGGQPGDTPTLQTERLRIVLETISVNGMASTVTKKPVLCDGCFMRRNYDHSKGICF